MSIATDRDLDVQSLVRDELEGTPTLVRFDPFSGFESLRRDLFPDGALREAPRPSHAARPGHRHATALRGAGG